MATDEPRVSRFTGEYIELYSETYYRGKTNGYVREQTIIRQITDRDGCAIQIPGVQIPGVTDWTMIGDGIEACCRHEATSALYGSSRHERRRTLSVRIYRRACPVTVTFLEVSDYADYFDSEFSTSSQRTERVIFESSS